MTRYRDHLGTVLSNVLQTLLTFGNDLVPAGGKLVGVQLTSTGAIDRTVEVYLIPSGQVAANQYLIYKDVWPAGQSAPIPGGPWFASNSAFVQAKMDGGTDVTARATAFEETV